MEITGKDKYRILLPGIMIFLLCTIIAVQVLAQEVNRDEIKPLNTGWQHLALTNMIGETPKAELARNINKFGTRRMGDGLGWKHHRIRKHHQNRLLLQETTLTLAKSLIHHTIPDMES